MTRPGRRHIRHIGGSDPLGVICQLPGGSRPLMRGAVTDPRGPAAMQVQGCPVLRVVHGVARGDVHAQRTHTGSHEGGIHRQEEIAPGAGGQQIRELYPHRPILLGDDDGPQVMGVGVATILLHIPPQLGRGKVGVHLLGVLHQRDLVVVGSRVGRGVGNGHRDALPEVIGRRTPESGQAVHELSQVRAVGEVGHVNVHCTVYPNPDRRLH